MYEAGELPDEGKHLVSLLCTSLELTVWSSQGVSLGFPIAKEHRPFPLLCSQTSFPLPVSAILVLCFHLRQEVAGALTTPDHFPALSRM